MRRPRSFDDDQTSAAGLPWVYILLALSEDARHGYAIMREVQELTGGRVTLWPATLYGAIRRMEAAGLIEPVAPRALAAPSERRRRYRLTPAGRRVLEQETRRLADLVNVARRRGVLATTRSSR
jgi:DNA-binding PadR family transcriptional regulator